MPTLPTPATTGDVWGNQLNNFLKQLQSGTNGGINTGTTDPASATDGYTYINSVTREVRQKVSGTWTVLLKSAPDYNFVDILNQPTMNYPDGLTGEDKLITLSDTATYTVPAGKNLYIHQQSINNNFDGNDNWYSVVYATNGGAPQVLSQLAVSATRTPYSRDFLDGSICVPTGTILSSNVNGVTVSVTEVPKKVDLKLIYLAANAQYLTTGRFVVTYFGGVDLAVNGKYFDYSSDQSNLRRQVRPLILPAGSTISGGPDYNFFSLNGAGTFTSGCFISGYEF